MPELSEKVLKEYLEVYIIEIECIRGQWIQAFYHKTFVEKQCKVCDADAPTYASRDLYAVSIIDYRWQHQMSLVILIFFLLY